jgi:hypothetical protein
MTFTMRISVLLIVFFYVISLLVLWEAIKQIRRAYQVRTWPTTDAHLTRCELVTTRDEEDTWYQVSVNYSYELNGVQYVGDTLTIDDTPTYNRARQEQTLQKVRSMAQFVICYHPDMPGTSAVFPVANATLIMAFLPGAVALVVTTCFAIVPLVTTGYWRTMAAWLV